MFYPAKSHLHNLEPSIRFPKLGRDSKNTNKDPVDVLIGSERCLSSISFSTQVIVSEN